MNSFFTELPSFSLVEGSASAGDLPLSALGNLRRLYEKIAGSSVLTSLTLELCRKIAAGELVSSCGEDLLEDLEVKRFRLLLILLCYPAARENYRRNGYADSDFETVWRDIAHWGLYYLKECGELRFDSLQVFQWFFLHVTAHLIQLGRLQFQLPQTYREPFDLSPYIHAGDPVIEFHIYGGEPLKMDACYDSLKRLRVWLSQNRKDYKFRALVSHSWLFSPELDEFLPESSNIVRFRRAGKIIGTQEPSDVLWRIFGEKDPERVAEPNGLQHRVLDFYHKGGILHYGFWILPQEEFYAL